MEFYNTWKALERLEESIICDLCSKRSGKLSFIGSCDHAFCETCCHVKFWEECPICKIPITIQERQPSRQLEELFETCGNIRRLLEQYQRSFDETGNVTAIRNKEILGRHTRPRSLQIGDNQLATLDSSQPKENTTSGIDQEPIRKKKRFSDDGNFESIDTAGGKSSMVKINRKGETELHLACQKGDTGAVIRLLSAENPADPNVTDNAGWTPLHEASIYGHSEIVGYLLNAGAVIDPVGPDFLTPLHMAIQRRHVETVRTLVYRGADIRARMANGGSVWSLAISASSQGKGAEEIIDILNGASELQMIKPTPVTVMQKRKRGPIGLSYSGLKNEQIRQIINMGTRPNLASGFRLMMHFDPISTTHLIVGENPAKRSFKYLAAVLKGKWVVTFDWIVQSINDGYLVDEEEFEVDGSENNPSSDGPKRARKNFQMLKPGLFAGCRFCFCGYFPKPNLSVENLKDLVEMGGGIVEKRLPVTEISDGDQYTTSRPYHAGNHNWESSFIVITDNQTVGKSLSRRASNVQQVPLSWLIDCIDHFRLLPFHPSSRPASTNERK